jgi:uncharacterized cupredoxin-like copper-binding protein
MFDLKRTGRLALVPLALTGTMFVAACSDDEEEEPEATTTATAAATQAPTQTATATPTEEAGETIEVTAVDYAFEGLPASVAAGTMLTLTNTSEAELHELVAFRLPDEETRSAEELLALPEEEAAALLESGPPSMVIIAMPGEAGQAVIGDGTVTEPGRYLIACFIPTGADPAEYVAAAQESGDEPPVVEGGPPHVANGMFAELTVE